MCAQPAYVVGMQFSALAAEEMKFPYPVLVTTHSDPVSHVKQFWGFHGGPWPWQYGPSSHYMGLWVLEYPFCLQSPPRIELPGAMHHKEAPELCLSIYMYGLILPSALSRAHGHRIQMGNVMMAGRLGVGGLQALEHLQ